MLERKKLALRESEDRTHKAPWRGLCCIYRYFIFYFL